MTTNMKWKLAAGVAAVAAAAAGGVAISAAVHKDPAVSSAGSTPGRQQFGPPDNGQGGPRGGGRGFRDALDAAAAYLGLSTSDLLTQLQSGKTLAQLADATSGKSAADLIAAMVAAQAKQIDSAVQAGTMTQEQATQLKASLEQRITALVNGSFGGGRGGPGGFGGGGGTPRTGTV